MCMQKHILSIYMYLLTDLKASKYSWFKRGKKPQELHI